MTPIQLPKKPEPGSPGDLARKKEQLKFKIRTKKRKLERLQEENTRLFDEIRKTKLEMLELEVSLEELG